jgi:hypothetical protein
MPLKHQRPPQVVGDETEDRVRIAIQSKLGLNVRMYGHATTYFDLGVTVDSVERAVQVKTLSNAHQSSTYGFFNNGLNRYPSDLLLVAVDSEWKRFFCAFVSECKPTTRISLPFGGQSAYTSDHYVRHMFMDESSWLDTIMVKIRNSTIVTRENMLEHMCKTSRIEFESRERLVPRLHQETLEFTPNHVLGSPIDGWINDHSVQLKYTSNDIGTKHTSWQLRLHRYSHRNGKKEVYVPYHENDGVDFYVIETEGNHWFIIPKDVLVRTGMLTTRTQPGRDQLRLSLPTHKLRQKQMNGRPVYGYAEYYQNWDALKARAEITPSVVSTETTITQTRDEVF